MAKRLSHQEWHTLFDQYESSHLSQRVFCEQNGLSLSTFHAKRQQLKFIEQPK
ncbi:IS66 family insertion sequence element accessory protein TnpA, partial [Vibrio anguillarum]